MVGAFLLSGQVSESIVGSWTSLSDPRRLEIVEYVWPTDAASKKGENFSAYFEKHFKSQCTMLAGGNSLKTHQDVIDLISHIRGCCHEPRSDLRQSIRTHLPQLYQSDEQLDRAITLAVRLWLMVNIEDPSRSLHGIHILPQTEIRWPDDMSLSECLTKRFVDASCQETKNMRFSKFLNVVSLRTIGGFKIHWTENLLDHLVLEEDRVVCVFHYASVLRRLRNSMCPVLPTDFLDETLRTIALLIPTTDAECYRWLLEGHGLDTGIQSLGRASREVNQYSYWRDRLLILEEAFEEAEPVTLSQWWHDRRKKFQWYTFWIAIVVLVLTIIFGVIQSITAILQTWKALNA